MCYIWLIISIQNILFYEQHLIYTLNIWPALKQIRSGISRSKRYVGVLVGIMEIWKIDLRNTYFSILCPIPTINPRVAWWGTANKRSYYKITYHSIVSGNHSLWKAAQRTKGIFAWWRTLSRRPQVLYLLEERLPWYSILLILNQSCSSSDCGNE